MKFALKVGLAIAAITVIAPWLISGVIYYMVWAMNTFEHLVESVNQR